MIKDVAKYFYKKLSFWFQNVKNIFRENLQPTIRVVILTIIGAGIAYPLLLVLIGSITITLPFQSTGSLLTLDRQVVGSKLIAQEFKSDKLFHVRPGANSTSSVDPHITPKDAYWQIPRITLATGLPYRTLKTAIQYNVEEQGKQCYGICSPFMNVLEINLVLISGNPNVYQELVKTNYSVGVR